MYPCIADIFLARSSKFKPDPFDPAHLRITGFGGA